MLKLNNEKHSFLSNLLMNKRFRICRHVLLILAIAIIAINATLGTFGESYPIIGNKIYRIALFSLVLYLVVIYFNLYILVPKLLLQSKYLQYIIALVILVFVFILVSFGSEYYIFKHEDIAFRTSSSFHSAINFISEFLESFVIYSMLIVSISMTALFKSWLINTDRISQLETTERRTQLENMKEKISPSFLSRMLKKSASLATSAPQSASEILLKLSKILRYQLYDCSRDKVLLNSETTFLANYLDLEKVYYENFDYSIIKDENTIPIFIPPLLFLPFVQQCMMQAHERQLVLELQFLVKENQLQFTCRNNGTDKINYLEVSHRIELLYSGRYSIYVGNERELTIQIDI